MYYFYGTNGLSTCVCKDGVVTCRKVIVLLTGNFLGKFIINLHLRKLLIWRKKLEELKTVEN